MTWERGQATLEQLLDERRLEQVTGAAADPEPWLRSAAALLDSARRECATNPEAAFVLAYDAARKGCTALLIQQGLRTRGTGHHFTVEQAVRAQFGGPFDAFGALRRRRTEIEYPQRPGDELAADEAPTAIAQAAAIIDAAMRLAPQLALFRPPPASRPGPGPASPAGPDR